MLRPWALLHLTLVEPDGNRLDLLIDVSLDQVKHLGEASVVYCREMRQRRAVQLDSILECCSLLHEYQILGRQGIGLYL